MCGICGIFEYGRSAPTLDDATIERMRETLAHRGPDAAGSYLSPDRRVGLGHRRLSIIDLSDAARQPLANEDGTVWIVYNGEIYNYAALRRGLLERGHRFQSRSDTETILHLYEEAGPACVRQLDGMFAFAIWDSRERTLLLARDRLGIKPLYYAQVGGRFVFGSEIKAILASGFISPELDEEALYHYLTFLVSPAPFTLFQGIRKLPAAHTLTVSQDGRVALERFWDPLDAESPGELHDEEWAERVLELLGEATRKRMMSDVPFGAFLSGGLDSSTNVALMSRYLDLPVNTFSIGFEGHATGPHNELAYAREVADAFGANHRETVISSEDIEGLLARMMYHFDDPVASSIAMSHHFVSQLARDHGVVVAQVGEGSDELFWGYSRYWDNYQSYASGWRRYHRLPRAVRRCLHGLLDPVLATRPGWGRRRELVRKAAHDEELYWGYENIFSETDKRRLLSRGFRRRHPGLTSYEVVRQHLDEFAARSPDGPWHRWVTYLDLKVHMAERMLMRTDKMAMAVGVETRVPFLDHRLVECAIHLPLRLKAREGLGKIVLRQAVEALVPPGVLERKKVGFLSPLRLADRQMLADLLDRVVLRSSLRERDIFDYDRLMRVAHPADGWVGRGYLAFESLLFLHLWYELWIDGRDAQRDAALAAVSRWTARESAPCPG